MNDTNRTILLADSEARHLGPLGHALGARGVGVRSAGSAAAAVAAAREPGVAAIVAAPAVGDDDGVATLVRAAKAAPDALRVFVPEGGAPEHVLRAVGAAEHVMARPADTDELLGALERRRALREALGNPRLARLAKLPGGLPPLPPLYDELVEALQGPDATLDKVGAVLEQDAAATAQVLDLVNSAWFGLMERVTSVAMAINYLGVTSVASLVLSGFLFREVSKRTLAELGASGLWDRSMLSATYAREIARLEDLTSRETDDAFTASLLHGAGRIVLAARATEDYKQIVRLAGERGTPLADAERTALGFTSDEAGAFLLASWGLPNSVVEAVCFRTRPAELPHETLQPLTVAHVATALGKAGAPHNWSPRTVSLDEAYLEAFGGSERVERWKGACRSAVRLDEARA